ncbi:MAG TPA: hypothetical protein VNH18_02695 [Bryobacteraceae bacterium]|nr:hypothetical protein [Bryobacteraceae bacterium]
MRRGFVGSKARIVWGVRTRGQRVVFLLNFFDELRRRAPAAGQQRFFKPLALAGGANEAVGSGSFDSWR